MIRNDRMRILTRDGVIDTQVWTDGVASLIGSYWNAVRHYLYTGATDRLDEFEGENINFHWLLTDPDRIDELATIGEIDLVSIYTEPQS